MTIIAEDIDLLVLYLALTPVEKNIFYMKPGKGRVQTKIYSTAILRNIPFASTILLLNVFSRCDTTSAIFNKGKSEMVKTFTKFISEITEINNVFSNPDTTKDKVTQAEEKLFLLVYQAPEGIDIKHSSRLQPRQSLIGQHYHQPKELHVNPLRVYLQVYICHRIVTVIKSYFVTNYSGLFSYLQIQQWLQSDFENEDKFSPTK